MNTFLEDIKDIKIPNTKKNRDILTKGRNISFFRKLIGWITYGKSY